MSRVVKIYDSNYKVAVQSGGVITLDTGALTGTTVITGNLEVKGATTNVSSTNVNIDDNILVLSDGTVGNGLPASVQYKSGIEVERGEYENAQWVYDEQVTWTLGGLSSGSLPAGTFYAAVGNQKLPINTPGIVAQGNLYVDTGNGIITVTGTNNYEEKIWNYNNGVVTPDNNSEIIVDDDNIPNAKAVKDYVEFVFASQFYDTIAGGDTSVKVIDETHILGSIVAVSSGSSETTISTQGQHNFTVSDTIDICYLAWKNNKCRHYSISNHKSYTILEVAKMFGSKIKFLPKRSGERYASALTNINLNNRVFKYFGNISLKNYIKNIVK